MDFLLVSALQRYLSLGLIVNAYDIYCQYMIRFRQRLIDEFPPEMIDQLESIVSAKLPKLIGGVGNYHLPMHIAKCRAYFSLHYCPGAGKEVGEQCELKACTPL